MHDLFIYLCINSCYQLKQEIEDHRGHVNTLVFEEDGGKMYSGDSAGNVIIFNVFVGEQEPRLGNFLFTVQCLEDKNPTWLCKIMLLISLNISNHSLKHEFWYLEMKFFLSSSSENEQMTLQLVLDTEIMEVKFMCNDIVLTFYRLGERLDIVQENPWPRAEGCPHKLSDPPSQWATTTGAQPRQHHPNVWPQGVSHSQHHVKLHFSLVIWSHAFFFQMRLWRMYIVW